MRPPSKWVGMALDLWFHKEDHRATMSRYVTGSEQDGFSTSYWLFRYWNLDGSTYDLVCASRQEAEAEAREYLTRRFG